MLTIREITAVGAWGTYGRSIVVISSTLNQSGFDNSTTVEKERANIVPKDLVLPDHDFRCYLDNPVSLLELHGRKVGV